MKIRVVQHLIGGILALSVLGSCSLISLEHTWREKWWDYYDRGVTRLEEGEVDDAVSDFHVAIGKRFQDQYNARMYGMHFTRQYFPHRELGVALLEKGEYQSAIQELEVSLSQLDSAKARYHLDEARKGYLNETGADKEAPSVSVLSHTDGAVIAALETTIQGQASDDFYVGQVSIGGQRIKLDVSDKEVTFERAVTLTPGPNEILIAASDLTGKRTEQVLHLLVDRAVPIRRQSLRGVDSPSSRLVTSSFTSPTAPTAPDTAPSTAALKAVPAEDAATKRGSSEDAGEKAKLSSP